MTDNLDDWNPSIATYVEAGVIEERDTGEVMAYIEIQNLDADGETVPLRIGLTTRDGLWLGLSVIERTLRASLIRNYRKARGK